MESFPEFFARALQRSGMTRTRLAQQTRTPVSVISEVLHGRRKPPLRRTEAWAEALGLGVDERTHWRRLACLAHAPPEITEWVRALHREIEGLSPVRDRRDSAEPRKSYRE